jgi:hypothetical protein
MANKVLIILSKISPKITEVIDVTSVFQPDAAQSYIQDVSGWDSVVVQIVSPTSAVNFNTTGDNGYVLGQLLPVPQVPVNWLPVQGTNILTNESVSTVSQSSAVRFQNIGKFLRISYGTAQVSPAALLPVAPQMIGGGNISVQTAATGTNYTAFASQVCKQLTLSNQSGVTIEVRQGAAGVGLQIPTGAFYTFFGITNATQLDVRRFDTQNTQVTITARWEA